VYAWVAVFVLPLNAAANPLLYTLSTASFLGHARRKASSFFNSFGTSNGTKGTLVTGTGRSQRCADQHHHSFSFVVYTLPHTDRVSPPSGHYKAGHPRYEVLPLRSVKADRPIHYVAKKPAGQNGRTSEQSIHTRRQLFYQTTDSYSLSNTMEITQDELLGVVDSDH
jgi:hypothetical protein